MMNQENLSKCRLCISGMACPTTGLSYPTESCSAGYYCPLGSALPTAAPCPAGTYTDYRNLTSAVECTVCPQGQACYAGTGGFENPPKACGQGEIQIHEFMFMFIQRILFSATVYIIYKSFM